MTSPTGSPTSTIKRICETSRYDLVLWLIRFSENYGTATATTVLALQEVTQRVLEAVGGIAGSSLEQTSWLSRSLEVKVQPQICAEADEADEAEMDGDHDGTFIHL